MSKSGEGCPFPGCEAGEMLAVIKESNKEYRSEIQRQLVGINSAIQEMTKAIHEHITGNKLAEQAIKYLRDDIAENKAAHIVIFQRIESIEDRGRGWMWDTIRLLVVAGLGVAAGKLF